MSCHPFGRTRIFHGIRNWTDSTQSLPPCFCCHPYNPFILNSTICILVEVQTGRGRLHDPEVLCFIPYGIHGNPNLVQFRGYTHAQECHTSEKFIHRVFPPVTFRPHPIQRLDRGLRSTSDWTPDNPAFTLYQVRSSSLFFGGGRKSFIKYGVGSIRWNYISSSKRDYTKQYFILYSNLRRGHQQSCAQYFPLQQ